MVHRMAFSEQFFEVTAQLLPVLLIAMAVEEGLRSDEETVWERVGRSWLVALFVLGELLSLAVVAGGLRPSRSVGTIVVCGLFDLARDRAVT